MSMLVTLAAMKTKLGISDGSQDAFLTEQITLISDTIEAYCRRVFGQATYTQTWYEEDMKSKTNTLITYMFPVISVTSVILDDITVLAPTDYRFHKPTGTFTPTDDCMVWADKLVMVYVAGYATIPSIIQEAVYSLVSERYNKKSAGVDLNFGSDVQRISIPGTMSIDFDYSLQNNDRKTTFGVILGNYLNVLDYWRSERAIIGSGELKYVE